MSYVIAEPEIMTSAATDLATIGSDLSAAHTAAASTTQVLPAAADEVSAGIAHLFSGYAGYQAGEARASGRSLGPSRSDREVDHTIPCSDGWRPTRRT